MSQDSKASFSNPNYKSLSEGVKDNPIFEVLKKIDEKNTEINSEIEKLKEENLIDPLTNCYNAKYFQKFKQERFDPNRDDNTLALVFIDLNELKNINDTQGHKAGDQLIIDAANYFKSIFRKGDEVIRLGGDEFVVVCHNNKNDIDFENRLTNKTKERRIKNHGPSFAFGVAAYNEKRDLHDIENTQKLADERMYQDKREMKLNSF